jgi:phospholipid/cholesterol/gamma-HCH transport system substrate-binding protein
VEERSPATRLIISGLLVLALAVVVVLFARGSDPYRLTIELSNASQLVKGNQIEVGGYEVGTIKKIELGSDNQAHVEIEITDDSLTPLHQGTRAWVRAASVSGVANRYIAVAPGPNSADELKSGATIPAAATEPSVDLDAALSTFDGETRRALQGLIHGAADIYSANGPEGLSRTLRYLDPAVAQLSATLGELTRDRGALEKFIVASSSVVSAVADRQDDLEAGISSAAKTAGALARERQSLTAVLAKAPPTLQQATRSLNALAGTLDTVTPVARKALPVAPKLRRFISAVTPALERGATVLPRVRSLLPPLRTTLAGLPALRKEALPSFARSAEVLEKYLPIIKYAFPYVPDAVLGATNGFGGTPAGYYDANGGYARIAAQFGPEGPGGIFNLGGSLGPLEIKYKVNKRCPGAATQVTRDGSNEFDAGVDCDKGDRP